MDNTTNFAVSLPLSPNTSLLYVMIELFGLFGNALVVFAICSSCRLKTNYYFLVFHVAVCDIVMVLTGNMLFGTSLVVQKMSVETYETLDMIGRNFVHPFANYIFVCESLFLVIIAVERYKAVTKPLQPQLSKKRLNYIVFGVYIVGLALHALNTYCVYQWHNNKYLNMFQWIWEITASLLPLTIIIVLYTKMCRSLFRHNKRAKELFHSEVSNRNQTIESYSALERNRRTIIISIVVVVQFFASVLPARVIHLLVSQIGIRGLDYYAFSAMMLYFLGSCGLNPITYGLLDVRLRAAYVKCFKKFVQFFIGCIQM